MKDAITISKYISNILPIDNLKLQKLLYYSQAVHLVLNKKKPLFSDKIEAWMYGPVVPSVYRKYKKFGFDIIVSNEQDIDIDNSERDVIDMVLSYYGEMSPMELVSRTHKERPWVDAYRPSFNNPITNEALYSYFSEVLEFD